MNVKIPPASFCGTLAVNVDNDNLPDAEFRQMCRNTLPSVEYDTKCKCGKGGQRRWLDRDEKGYWCSDCWTAHRLSLLKPVPKSAVDDGVDNYPAKKIYRWVTHPGQDHKSLILAPGGSSIWEGDLWR